MSGLPATFLKQNAVTIKRLSYVGGKGTFSTVGTTRGYFRPLDESQASANGFQFGQAHVLLVGADVDIRESDTVEVDGQEFTVNGVATHDRLSLKHRRCLLTLPENP